MNDVDDVLRRYPCGVARNAIEPLGAAGGMSGARFWRIVTHRSTFMLRCWPSEHPSPDRLRFIHAVLEYAERRGITFLPVPIKTGTGRSFLVSDGRLWELAPWMPGTADFAQSPSIEKLRAAMIALAQFHVAVADFAHAMVPGAAAGSSAVTQRLARLRERATRTRS
jgi:homoserine kinase type II